MMKKQQKYEALVRAMHSDIFRYAYWLIGDKTIAEDVVQETFLRAWKSLDSLKDEKAAKSWLITIVRRENARRFERKQLETVDMTTVSLPDETSHEADLQTHQLRFHISQLTPEYREPLILQVLMGYSGDEIANQLGLNKNTVMTRLFRARSQLKEKLDAQQPTRGYQNG